MDGTPRFGPTLPVARGLRRRQTHVLCRTPCVASQSANLLTEHAEPRLGLGNETSPGSDNAGQEQDEVGLEQDEAGLEQDEVGLGLEQDEVGLGQDEIGHWTTGWTSRGLDDRARPGQNRTRAGRLD